MIDETLKDIFDNLDQAMNKALEHTQSEFQKLRAGKATPSMLDSVMVEYYGSNVPLSQVSNISTPDARTIWIQPWEKNLMQDIERAIINANLGYNPQNDGERVMINIPPLTEERRKNLVKSIKHEAENGKVGLRSARKDAMEFIKMAKKDGLSEDLAKDAEVKVQEVINAYGKKIDALVELKEKEIMTI